MSIDLKYPVLLSGHLLYSYCKYSFFELYVIGVKYKDFKYPQIKYVPILVHCNYQLNAYFEYWFDNSSLLSLSPLGFQKNVEEALDITENGVLGACCWSIPSLWFDGIGWI